MHELYSRPAHVERRRRVLSGCESSALTLQGSLQPSVRIVEFSWTHPYAPLSQHKMAARTRHVLVALPRDATEAAVTLRWVAANLSPESDAYTLLHVRQADLTAAHAAPFAPEEEPVSSLASEVFLGTEDDAVADAVEAARALGPSTRFLKLRSPMRVIDVLMAYVASLPEDHKADTLVLGSHTAAANAQGWRAASHVSTDIAATSPIPVFLVRSKAPPPDVEPPRRFVVIAVDGRKPTSTLLVRWATQHVLRPSDTVLLCHKPTGDKAAVEEVEACADALRIATRFTEGQGTALTDSAFTSGFDVRDALVDLAQSGVAGVADGPPVLMVLASRGPAPLKRLALGSVCAYVVQHAACSLAVVPPPALVAAEAAATHEMAAA